MSEKEIEKYIIDNYFIKNQFEIAEDLEMIRNQTNIRAPKIGIRKHINKRLIVCNDQQNGMKCREDIFQRTEQCTGQASKEMRAILR